MRMFLSLVVVFAVSFGVMAGEPQADDAKKKAVDQALETFVGTWEIVASQPEGVTKDARKLVFRNDMTYAALDKDGKELWAGTYDLEPTASPKVWDHRSNKSKESGGDALGIYELDGDKLKVACVVGAWKGKLWTGKPRPKTIEPKEADAVIELKRVKNDGA